MSMTTRQLYRARFEVSIIILMTTSFLTIVWSLYDPSQVVFEAFTWFAVSVVLLLVFHLWVIFRMDHDLTEAVKRADAAERARSALHGPSRPGQRPVPMHHHRSAQGGALPCNGSEGGPAASGQSHGQ